MSTSGITFSGLSSGLDTEAIVEALTQSYKTKHDTAVQEQKLMELKKDKYKEVNTKVMNFYDNFVRDLRLESSYMETEQVISNPDLLSIEGSLSEGSHEITDIQLVQKANLQTEQLDEGFDSNTSLSEMGFEKGDTITLSVDGKEVSVEIGEIQETNEDGTTTTRLMNVSELEAAMNEKIQASDLTDEQKEGINFSFNKSANGFMIGSENANIELSTTSTTAGLEDLGIKTTSAEYKPGSITYNGLKIYSDNNEYTIDGATLTATGTGDVTVSQEASTDGMVDKIVGFVDAYNTLIGELNEMINGPYNRDYLPLTAEQEEAMTESEIELWNERIDEGLLRNDPILEQLTTELRSIMGSTVEGGEFELLAHIGISTSADWSEKGKLHIDEAKLKEAIENNPEDVVKLFVGDDENKGVMEKVYDSMTDMFAGTTQSSSMNLFNDKLLDKEIEDQEDTIAKLLERLEAAEARYFAQFTAMEVAMSELNSQGSILSSYGL